MALAVLPRAPVQQAGAGRPHVRQPEPLMQAIGHSRAASGVRHEQQARPPWRRPGAVSVGASWESRAAFSFDTGVSLCRALGQCPCCRAVFWDEA
jgi:hypothetical protein